MDTWCVVEIFPLWTFYQYVAGGMVNAQTRLDSVERWCPNTNKWETVASLPVPLSSLCLVACAGQLYAIGKCYFILEFCMFHTYFVRRYFNGIENSGQCVPLWSKSKLLAWRQTTARAGARCIGRLNKEQDLRVWWRWPFLLFWHVRSG